MKKTKQGLTTPSSRPGLAFGVFHFNVYGPVGSWPALAQTMRTGVASLHQSADK
jgi:hypothetical protein